MSQIKYQSKKKRYNRDKDRCDCDCSSHDHHKSSCICSNNLCNSRFRLRLRGLKGGLNFRLRQLKGRVVILEFESNKEIEARICVVGPDFVEADVVRKGKVLILPFVEIKDVKLKDN